MKFSTIDAFVGNPSLVFDHNRHPTPPINEGKMANHIRFKGRSLPATMRFLTIAISLCVGLALGQDAQLGPAAASVATDVPVLRHPAGGDGDAVRPELGPAPETALSSTASVDSKVKDKKPPSIVSMIAGYLSQSDTNNSLPQLAQEVESDGHHLDGSDTDGPSTKSPDTKMVMPAETKSMSDNTKHLHEVSHLLRGSKELDHIALLSEGISATKVRIQLNSRNYLQLTEVKVFDTSNTEVAQQGTATQSSEYYNMFPASNAIDGKTDNFSHTWKEQGAWWEVDLRSRYAITRVEVRNRFNCCGERLSNSRVILKDGASPVADYNIGAAYTNELLNIPESSFKKVTDKQPEKFKYKDITVRASVHRERVQTLAAGTNDYWKATTKMRTKTRTSRSTLYEVAKKESSSVKASVEMSLKAGASFPFKGISFSGEASSTFRTEVENSIHTSSKFVAEYSRETESMFERAVTQHYSAYSKTTDSDRVVYHEVWKIGGKVFKSNYFACDEVEFDAMKSEVEDITWRVGVDYQWYKIQANNVAIVIAEGNPEKYNGVNLIMWKPSNSFTSSWRFDDDDKNIVNRGGRVNYYITVPGPHGLPLLSNHKRSGKVDHWTVMPDGTIKSGHGYCMDVEGHHYHNGQRLTTRDCDTATRWTWNKVD